MKRLKKIVSIVLAVAIVFSGAALDATKVQASSARWKKACKAYNTWLAKNVSKFNGNGDATIKNYENYKKTSGFLLIDLDKNNVPELVVSHPVSCRSTDFYVYTYKSGKVVQVKDTNGKKGKSAAIWISTQANGNHVAYRCTRNHLHISSGGGWWEDEKIYIVKKGKLYLYARGQYDTMMDTESYIVNGKKSTANKYQQFYNKCGMEEYLLMNTKSNRRKYLK